MWMRTKHDWDKDEDPSSNEKKVSQDSWEGSCFRRQRTRETRITIDLRLDHPQTFRVASPSELLLIASLSFSAMLESLVVVGMYS